MARCLLIANWREWNENGGGWRAWETGEWIWRASLSSSRSVTLTWEWTQWLWSRENWLLKGNKRFWSPSDSIRSCHRRTQRWARK